MLNVENVTLTYEVNRGLPVLALEDLSFRVEKSEFVILCGPSGCGKSSILRLVAGLLSQQRGEVTVDGVPVQGPSPERGIVFQSYNSFPWLSVRKNIEFSIKTSVPDPAERARIVARQIEVMGLELFADSYPGSLSGGMRQRVALARTLAMSPLILLLDEPFGALDPMTRYSLQLHLQTKAVENAWTVVFVTHDVDEAILLADRVLVLSQRPAKIISEESIPFHRPRTRAIRDTSLYVDIRRKLSAILEGGPAATESFSITRPGEKGPRASGKTFSWARVFRDRG